MSANYLNYHNHYKNNKMKNYTNIPPNTYYLGKILKSQKVKGIVKKNVLEKFESLEHKLLDYLAEFVKYSDSCRHPKGSRNASPSPSGPGKNPSPGRSDKNASPGRPAKNAPCNLPAPTKNYSISGYGKNPTPSRSPSPSPIRIYENSVTKKPPQVEHKSRKETPLVEHKSRKETPQVEHKSRKETPQVQQKSRKETPQVEDKSRKSYNKNLEKKIIQIEQRTKNIQKYNKILEESFKKYKIGNVSQEAIVLEPRLKETIFREVKKLEGILIEKKLEDQNIKMKDIPEYEHCQSMLQECIVMLGEAIKEEKQEDKKKQDKENALKLSKQKERPSDQIEKKKKIENKLKTIDTRSKSRKQEDMSDDEFFGQYNLNISDEEFRKEKLGKREISKKKEANSNAKCKGPQKDDHEIPEEYEEEAADKLSPLQNFGGVRLPVRGEYGGEREEEEVKGEDDQTGRKESEPKYIEHDKRKLFEIQKELGYLEHNNERLLNVLHGLKRNLMTKNLEEKINGYEFADEVHQMKEVTHNFEMREKNVDKLIGNLKKHTRYIF